MLYQRHTPVLTAELIDLFQPKSTDILLDATIGTGGHAAAYLATSAPGGQVVGLDADAKAIASAQHYLSAYQDRVTLLTANFANLKDSLLGGGILTSAANHPSVVPTGAPADQNVNPSLVIKKAPKGLFTHILFDLGIGSHQLGYEAAGFSFQSDGPLDMRFGSNQLPDSAFSSINYLTKRLGHSPTAQELLDHLTVAELTLLIKTLGEEKFAGRIAQAIKRHVPATTQTLAALISSAVPASYEHGRIHPATRTFQALRLAVNRELEALVQALPQATNLLAPEGIIAVISFHSLEDRIVKQFFRRSLPAINKKPLRPSAAEIKSNPRARTAKLRAAKKPPG